MTTMNRKEDDAIIFARGRTIGWRRAKAFWEAFTGKPLTSGPRAEKLQNELRRQVARNFCREVK